MAKHKSKKSGGPSMRAQSGREQNLSGEELDTEQDSSRGEEADFSRDEDDSEMGSGIARADNQRSEYDPKQLLESFRNYIEGHPGRATALGAVFGGLAAGLLATDTGRSLLRASYSYARPMLSDYARKFVANQTGSAIEKSLPQ